MEKTANKQRTNEHIFNVTSTLRRNSIKHSVDYIIFPNFDNLGLIGTIFRQTLFIHDSSLECVSANTIHYPAMRIINNKVLVNDGKPDVRTLSQFTFFKWKSNNMLEPIGTDYAEAIVNLANLITRINDYKEKLLISNIFCTFKPTLWLHTISEEIQESVEITSELYNSGITYCVDWWAQTDENSNAPVTNLNIGDYLDFHYGVECIRRDEFLLTHSFTK